MIVDKPGRYELTERFTTRGAFSIATIMPGVIIEITQVDRLNHKVIGPMLEDWTHWELPVEDVE